MTRKDRVGDSGIDWSGDGCWLGAGDEEGDLPNQPVRSSWGLRTRNSSWEVARESRSIWVGSGTAAAIVAPVTWLAERERAVINQATVNGLTK